MTDLYDEPDIPDEDGSFEDFDAYWAQREATRRPPTVRIRGIDVEAPTDLPIELELRPERWANASGYDELSEYLGLLLGDVVDDLVSAGIGLRELQLLITWAAANGAGKRTTLADADALLTQAEVGEGKATAPNRTARRATQRPTRSGGAFARTGR